VWNFSARSYKFTTGETVVSFSRVRTNASQIIGWPVDNLSAASMREGVSRMRLSPAATLAVDRVRCFLKWNAARFDDLGKPEPMADPVGWKRGGEYWVRPDIWRDAIFDGDEDAAVDAARTLRDLDLLRTQQDSGALQAVVMIRGRKSARAYVVRPAILEWKLTTPAYNAYTLQPTLVDRGETEPPALISCTADGSITPADLAGKLELTVTEALDEAPFCVPTDSSCRTIRRGC
jgi:hypothetical protein